MNNPVNNNRLSNAASEEGKATEDNCVLSCRNLYKTYDEGPQSLEVLSGVNFAINAAERLAIVGSSGSGKSTLLNMLGGLDLPSSGEVIIRGNNINDLSDNQRGDLRNRYLGFVYQFHHLLREFTALENVAMPLLIRRQPIDSVRLQARQMLEDVGLGDRTEHKPSELSGGERQRVAIARSLVTRPACVLMDEPTGNLDHHTADGIHGLMKDLNKEFQTSFIVVTHDLDLAGKMDRVLTLIDGQLLDSSVQDKPKT